jgi:hypothetical protein
MDQETTKLVLNKIKIDISCGIHSGFPPCCVKFFVTKWVWHRFHKSNNKHWDNIRAIDSFDINYIPCPKCLKNKTFVKLKKCPKNCPNYY